MKLIIIKNLQKRKMGFSSSHLLCLFVLVISVSSSISSSSSPTTSSSRSRSSSSIPMSVLNTILPAHSDPLKKLTHLASTSIARAQHLKNKTISSSSSTSTPLYPYSGAYSISLSFGTPPQWMPLIMDTGSSFSWFPCTKRYICRNCSSSSSSSSSFIPKQSSSAKILGCTNPKCAWVHTSFHPNSGCQDCRQSATTKTNCTQSCPPYIILYGLGSTGGIAMVETLNMPPPMKALQDFVVGCSVFSSNQPAGVAGFGRGPSSLPSQLGLNKFSYCLVSHKFDNTHRSSSFLSMDDTKTASFSSTPLLKNSAWSDYYYVGLRKITVGGKKVEVSYQQLSRDSDGNGGTIVDSGSTFTYMNQKVLNLVADAFSEQVTDYKRAHNVENATGLRPCFDVAGNVTVVKMPQLKLHFKGGTQMAPPLENYFVAVDDDDRSREQVVVCLTMVTMDNDLVTGGPSVILGNFLMQNVHVEFDLTNERFGFRQQHSC